MKKIIAPPFVECLDNARCGQAVILMILKHFYPKRKWAWKDADKICNYKPNKMTSGNIAMLGMILNGFEAIMIANGNRKEYIAYPEAHIRKRNSKKEAERLLKEVDIPANVSALKQLLSSPHARIIERNWNWDDIAILLKNNFLVMAWVNSRKLYSRNNTKATDGHFVLIYGYQPEFETVLFHDGGSVITAENQTIFESNHWRCGRVGVNHFMNAAKSDHGSGGTVITAFRPRKS